MNSGNKQFWHTGTVLDTVYRLVYGRWPDTLRMLIPGRTLVFISYNLDNFSKFYAFEQLESACATKHHRLQTLSGRLRHQEHQTSVLSEPAVSNRWKPSWATVVPAINTSLTPPLGYRCVFVLYLSAPATAVIKQPGRRRGGTTQFRAIGSSDGDDIGRVKCQNACGLRTLALASHVPTRRHNILTPALTSQTA